jgi:apolipoprotein N-acyltransferase
MAYILRILLALCSSALLVLSFPSFNFHFLVWLALIPLFLAIKDQSPGISLFFSWISGLAFFMGVFYWINLVDRFTLIHFLIIMTYLGIYIGIFGFLLTFIAGRLKLPFIFIVPPIWVAMEYIRAHAGFMELPLAFLGHTQGGNPPLLQVASLSGAYGISFLIVSFNAGLADLLHAFLNNKKDGFPAIIKTVKKPFLRLAVCIAIILSAWVWGLYISSQRPPGKTMTIGVVQGNIPQEIKWDRSFREFILSRYETFSKRLMSANPKPQIIIWPEASTPGFILNDSPLYRRTVQLISELKSYFIIGSSEYPKFKLTAINTLKTANTALFFAPDGKLMGQYIKIKLLPFAEYVPLDTIMEWPNFILPKGKKQSYMAGNKDYLFSLASNRFGTLICWEVIFPEPARKMVQNGADFLINISNEAWFKDSAFPYQFLVTCIFRAVENRVNMVRATNTGISCFIDPFGRVTDRVTRGGKDIFVEGALTRDIVLSPPGSFYTRWGDWLAWGCFIWGGLLIGWATVKPRLAKGGPPS